MKRILLLLLFVSSLGFSQSSGITYQAVIYNPNGEELPGVDGPYAPLTNQDVCLQFGIVDADGNVEYQEEVQVTTDAFGMVNLLIGTNSQTGGYAADFAGVEWSADAKYQINSDFAIGLGYHFSKNFGLSSSEEKLNFNNSQLQFNLVMSLN